MLMDENCRTSYKCVMQNGSHCSETKYFGCGISKVSEIGENFHKWYKKFYFNYFYFKYYNLNNFLYNNNNNNVCYTTSDLKS